MLAEAIIENNEMKIINYSKKLFKGHHWKVNIEPIEEIKDETGKNDFIALMVQTPVDVSTKVNFLSRESVHER